MKSLLVCFCGFCIAGLLVTLAISATPTTSPATSTSLPITVTSDDPATSLVASFYKALTQKDLPTLEQEHALFKDESAIRASLLAQDKGKDKDPVVLQYFRDHRDIFIPINMKSLSEVNITTEFHFVRNVERLKDPKKPGNGYVIAQFVHDRKTASRLRTLVFTFEDGKIDPSAIMLDGFEGKSTLEEVLPNN